MNLSTYARRLLAGAGLLAASFSSFAGLPELSILFASANESDAGTGLMMFQVNLSQASSSPVSVNYATAMASSPAVPATVGADFLSTSGTLTFAPGETVQFIPVTIIGDTVIEYDEAFAMSLSSPVGATISGSGQTGGSIHDNDLGMVSVADASAPEGTGSSNSSLDFVVSVIGVSEVPVRVSYAANPVTATIGVDFLNTTGEIVIAPGETSKIIRVPVIADNLPELAETLSLQLLSVNSDVPGQFSAARDTAVGTIINDDVGVQLPVNDWRGLVLLMLMLAICGAGLPAVRT